MKQTDIIWTQKWAHPIYCRSNPSAKLLPYYETNGDIEGDVWRATQANAAGVYLKEGVSVLDYGCWVGMLFNFISGFVSNFNYFGLEPDSNGYEIFSSSWGKQSIDKAKEFFGHDQRARFGLIGSDIEQEAIEKCSVCFLGSVFTHISQAESFSILQKILPVIQRGCVVFSIFFSDQEKLFGAGAYGLSTTYSVALHKKEELMLYCKSISIALEEVDSFDMSGHHHVIFRGTSCAS